MYNIIYPDIKTVSAQTIRDWYLDAVSNGETDNTDIDINDINAMAMELQDIGHITLGGHHGSPGF